MFFGKGTKVVENSALGLPDLRHPSIPPAEELSHEGCVGGAFPPALADGPLWPNAQRDWVVASLNVDL